MNKETKNKPNLWWIVGLIFPLIGIVLYFVWKANHKEKAKSILVGSIISLFLNACTFLYFSTHQNDYFNKSVDSWYQDVSSGNTVVTVVGASYCGHCQEYKPIAKLLADKHKLNLYFYEIDELDEADSNKIQTSFELTGYSGAVPYTAIFKDGQVVDYHEGFESEAVLTDFFKNNGLIKN